MKLNATDRSMIKLISIVILCIIIIQYFMYDSRTSMYNTTSIDIQPVTEEPFAGLESKTECTNTVYSTSLGGVCGDQGLINAHVNYKIA
jgi:hypothetical protein